MKKTVWVALFVLIVAALALTACGGGDADEAMERKDVPSDYASMTNPFAGQADAVTAGQALFTTNCVSCHGETGAGDGPAAASLDLKPANLKNTVAQTEAAYQHWVISEGGAAAGLSSSMPAFKGSLSDDEIWQIVNYIEATFK